MNDEAKLVFVNLIDRMGGDPHNANNLTLDQLAEEVFQLSQMLEKRARLEGMRDVYVEIAKMSHDGISKVYNNSATL
jgi:hypothetical protein